MTNAEPDLSRLLQEGFDALNRGQLDVAAKACQSALSQRPDLAPAHFLVGLVAVEGDERRVAHEAFKSVVKIDRDHAAAWAQLARLNASEGRIALAESAFLNSSMRMSVAVAGRRTLRATSTPSLSPTCALAMSQTTTGTCRPTPKTSSKSSPGTATTPMGAFCLRTFAAPCARSPLACAPG
jgi:hypothetical protein